jgi:hypothetical protein
MHKETEDDQPMTKRIDDIRESDIATAIGMADLDDACAYLQGIAGIKDGGVAAQAFSDVNFNWNTADHNVRERKVREYIKMERVYEH